MDLSLCRSGWSRQRSIPVFAAISLTVLEFLFSLGVSFMPALANSLPRSATSEEPSSAESPPQPPEVPAGVNMTAESVQLDPLNSPYPVPWNWVLATLSEAGNQPTPKFRYYRSPSLISPDGDYAAYSRIQMQLSSDFTQSRVASVLFLENLRTGDLQTVTAASPLSDNPFTSEIEPNQAGTIAILIPVAWSESGDRVLAREFESLFGSDLASDFAVVWERHTNRAHTIAPTQVQYSNAVLLGWSQTHPDRVLFRAGNLGESDWPQWAVDVRGQTTFASEDQPMIFGQMVNSIWAGPQAYVRP